MKNYIKLNGTKIELTAEQVAEMQKSFGITQVKLSDVLEANGITQVKLSDVLESKTCKIGSYELIIAEHFEDGKTLLILKDTLVDDVEFGSSNNYDGSNVDNICNDFYKTLSDIVGKENICEYTLDLTANDGLKCYGSIKRYVSPLTAEMYRKYVYVLEDYKLCKWQWLVTPWSTLKHNVKYGVCCVSPDGNVYCNNYYNNCGVRPFCILKSDIFVSKGE